jgi:hypothetical protein
VELLLGLRLPGGSSISQEVRPEDKMAADSQNGDIITLSPISRKISSMFCFNSFKVSGLH